MTDRGIGILYRIILVLCISVLSGLKWGWLTGGLMLSSLLLFFDVYTDATKIYLMVSRIKGTPGGHTADNR